MQALRKGERVRILTRTGVDWAKRYPLVAEAVAALKVSSCLIDGEIILCDDNGMPVFNKLLSGSQIKTDTVLQAFDLIELDGEDLRREPIEDRKKRLKALLREAMPSIQYTEHTEGDGAIVFAHACKLGLEASCPSAWAPITCPVDRATGSRRRTRRSASPRRSLPA